MVNQAKCNLQEVKFKLYCFYFLFQFLKGNGRGAYDGRGNGYVCKVLVVVVVMTGGQLVLEVDV